MKTRYSLEQFLKKEIFDGKRCPVRLDQYTYFADGEGHCDYAVDARFAVQTANEIGQIVEDGKVMLDHNDVIGRCQQFANRSRCIQTLFHVQVRRRLVEHVDIRLRDGLQNFPVIQMYQLMANCEYKFWAVFAYRGPTIRQNQTLYQISFSSKFSTRIKPFLKICFGTRPIRRKRVQWPCAAIRHQKVF